MPEAPEDGGRCEKMVSAGVVSFACTLNLPVGHQGPCAAQESPRSMSERRKWEERNRAALAAAKSPPPTPPQAQAPDATVSRPQTFSQLRGDPRDASLTAPHPGQVDGPAPPGTVATRPATTTGHVETPAPKPPETMVEMIEKVDCPDCGWSPGSDTLRQTIETQFGPQVGYICPGCGSFYVPGTSMRIIEPTPEPDPVPERAGREGDSQPLPTINDGPCIQDLVIADIEARKAVGIKRYGTVLQPFNGRDVAVDAYEEAIDLAVYLRQLKFERDRVAAEMLAAADLVSPGTTLQQDLLRWASILAPPT